MPQVIVAAAINYVGTALAWSATQILAAQVVGSLVVGKIQQKRAERKAKAAYNASLRDRMQMVDVQPNAAATLVLGRVRTVEGIRRRWVSGTHGEKLTLVISFAGHEIDGFEQFYFNDLPVTLSGSGHVLTAPYNKGSITTGSTVLSIAGGIASHVVAGGTIVPGTVSAAYLVGGAEAAQDPPVVSVSGSTITVTGNPGISGSVRLLWQATQTNSLVRIRTWNGSDAQNVGATLAAEYPDHISVNDRFAGMALAVVDLEFDPDVFPQGIPNITAVLRGARVLDPRTGTTAFTENPALLAYHYARHPLGWAVPADEIRATDVQADATVCEAPTTFPMRTITPLYPGGVVDNVTLPRYRCGIVIATDGDPRAAMDEICETMAGRWGWAGGTLRLRAGYSAAPSFALTPDWIASPLDDQGLPGTEPVLRLSNGVPRESKVNAVSGECVDPAQRWQILPFPAVVDSTLQAAEGAYELSVEYQGINHIAHAQHLARITIRQSQASLRMEASCNFSAYRCELFDVGAATLPRYGFEAKPFEVTGWRWHPQRGVQLSLAETSAEIYEVAELTGRDPAPNTTLPSLFDVPQLVLDEPQSGTAYLLRLQDGTIISRMRVSWPAVMTPGVREGGRIELRYGPATVDPGQWQTAEVPGTESQALLDGLQDGEAYIVQARAHNGLVAGLWSAQRRHVVVGKSEAPGNVTGLSASALPGLVEIYWAASTDADYAYTALREGTDWASGTPIAEIAANTYTWRPTATGEYQIFAKHFDTSGNESASATFTLVTVDSVELAFYRLDCTAAAWVLPATSAGVVTSYTGAYATVRVFAGTEDDTATWTLSKTDGPGVTSTLSEEGLLTLTALSSSFDVSYIDVVATKGTLEPLGWRVSISKARAGATGATGAPGAPGTAGNFVDYVFRRAATAPTTPTGDGTPVGWSDAPPTGSDPLWMSTAEKTAANVLVGSWSAPVRLDGAAGAPGSPGDAVQVEYSVNGSTGWHATFTAGDLYMRQRVGSGAWSAAIRIVGEAGAPGTAGNFIDYVFRRAASAPTTPTGSGTPFGWSDAPPTGSDPLWMSTAEKTSANVLVGSWSEPVRLDGADGAPGDAVQVEYSVNGSTGWHATFTAGDLYMRQRVGSGAWSAAIRIVGEAGAPGTRTAKVLAYHWAAADPGPRGGPAFTYTWATGAVSALPAGWTAVPDPTPIPGYKLWAAEVTLIDSTTDAHTAGNWSAATISVRGTSGFDGDDGVNGQRGTVITTRAIAGSAWSSAEANAAIAAATGGGFPVNSDQVTLYNTAASYSESRFYSAGSWLALSAYINGNLLVDGTVQASKVVTSSLSALSANLGTVTAGSITGVTFTGGLFRTAASGTRVVINEGASNDMRFYDGATLRARIGTDPTYGSYVTVISDAGYAIHSTASSGHAVYGASSGASGFGGFFTGTSAYGVYASSSSSNGLFAYSNSTAAIRASSGAGIAALLEGSVTINSASGLTLQASGTTRGVLYYIGSALKLEGTSGVPVAIASNGTEVARFGTDASTKLSGAFGCNNVTPPARATVSGVAIDEASAITLVNQLRAALINCGICQ